MSTPKNPTTTCAGCRAEMPLEVKEYTIPHGEGHLVERFVPRYCEGCHRAYLAELRMAREANASVQLAKAHAKVFDFIFDAIRHQGGPR